MSYYLCHTHFLCGLQSKWKRMMFTFKGRVKRVEGFCHVFISIRPHFSSGMPNIRFTLDISFSRGHISFSLRSDQLSDECHQNFRGNYFANLQLARLSWPMREEDEVDPTNENGGSTWRDPQLPGCALPVIPSARGLQQKRLKMSSCAASNFCRRQAAIM